jgi:hypothetical protein
MAVVIDGTNGISSPDYEVDGVTGQLYPIVSGTAKAWNWNGLTTNKEIDFTGIPSWVKRITVMFSGVSVSGSSLIQIQLGDSGGFETTGYVSVASAGATGGNSTTGLVVYAVGNASYFVSGAVTLFNFGANAWVSSSATATSPAAGNSGSIGGGTKTLSDTLTQVRITTVNGTDNFDAGTINIIYE